MELKCNVVSIDSRKNDTPIDKSCWHLITAIMNESVFPIFVYERARQEIDSNFGGIKLL